MRILFLFGHELVLGGHFKSAKAFAEQLIQRGHEVYVMAKGGKPETIDPFIEVGAVFIGMANTKRKQTSIFQRIRRHIVPDKSILQTIKNEKIEIIHAHDSPIMSQAYYAACLAGCGFVYSQAGGPFRDTCPPVKSGFFVFSQELLESHKNTGRGNQPTIHLIRARINTEIYRPAPVNDKFVQKYRLPGGGLTMVTAIRLHPKKEYWLNSLLNLSLSLDIKLNMVIAGDGELFSRLKKKADSIERKTQGRVKFIFTGGIYSEKEIAALINYSHVYIGNGRGLMEAMACAKPVIIAGEDNQYEFVGKDNVAVIGRYNFSGRHFRFTKKLAIDDYIQNLKHVLSSTQKMKELSTFSYEYAHKHLSAEAGAQKIEDLYRKALTQDNTLSDFIRWKLKRINLKSNADWNNDCQT